LAGFAIAAAGIVVRALASGHIRKNAALATTGPYAYTRNPLYLGSIVIALGFIVAARNVWIGVAAIAMFAFIYLPVIAAEE
jgi:protein-S-isoprenylcysteine O-methyltransferase Ste14